MAPPDTYRLIGSNQDEDSNENVSRNIFSILVNSILDVGKIWNQFFILVDRLSVSGWITVWYIVRTGRIGSNLFQPCSDSFSWNSTIWNPRWNDQIVPWFRSFANVHHFWRQTETLSLESQKLRHSKLERQKLKSQNREVSLRRQRSKENETRTKKNKEEQKRTGERIISNQVL